MKTIEAYKCEHCNKVYQFKKSCASHEKRCYKNPQTRSCASCIFLKKIDFEYHPNHYVLLLTCLRNHNTPGRLETGCNDYHFKKEKCNYMFMKEVRAAYYPYPFIHPIIERMRVNHVNDSENIINEQVEDSFFQEPF